MQATVTPDAERAIADISQRHSISRDAVLAMLLAVNNGGGFTSNNGWPGDLGVPSSSGGQNGARYAIFPSTRRLAIQVNAVTKVYDTADHRIGGVQQQQGTGYGSVGFTSQFGSFEVSSLRELGDQQVADTPVAAPAPSSSPEFPAAAAGVSDSQSILATIELLAGLHQRGIFSDDEFATKKAELLGRL